MRWNSTNLVPLCSFWPIQCSCHSIEAESRFLKFKSQHISIFKSYFTFNIFLYKCNKNKESATSGQGSYSRNDIYREYGPSVVGLKVQEWLMILMENLDVANLRPDITIIIYAVCLLYPHIPPPQLFVFKIATNLSTFASSYTLPSYITGELFWWHFDPHIINPSITMATNKEIFVSAFQEKSFQQIF